MRIGLLAAAPLITSMLVAGCGGDEACTTIGCQSSGSGDLQPSAGSGGTGGASGVAASGNTPGGFIDDDDTGAGGTSSLEDGEVCQELVLTAQSNPVNVLVLLDRSISMLEQADPQTPGVTRWDAITDALRAFVNSPQAEDARVGLQFFGLQAQDDCSATKYETPAVPIAPLAQNRAALLAAIDGTLPGSQTPTLPAVTGALTYARQVAQLPENDGVPTLMVLASDGIPSECLPLGDDGMPIISFREILDTLESFSAPPTDASGAPTVPSIRTFLVGTRELENNAEIFARAGNGQAFLVGGASSGPGLQQQFLDALLTIIVKPLDCEIDVPQTAPDTGEAIDFEAVRLRFTGAASGTTTEFPRATGANACGINQAWFYDGESPPQKLFLCPRACESLGAGELKLELGCAPALLR